MSARNKSKEELINELQVLQQAHNALKVSAEADSIAQKQTLEALEASEERFQLLFNKAPLGYQSLNFDGHFIEVNQQWLDTLGYEREEVIGKWFGDFLTPVFKDGFRKRFPIFKELGKIHSEFEMIHKSGSVLFIAFDGRIGYDVKGDFKQTHCILQDITTIKQAEKDLLKSRELLNTMEKAAKIGGWEFDVETMVQTWTEEIFHILEIETTHGTPDVPKGIGFIVPEYQPMALLGIQRAIEFGEPYNQEWEVITAKGNKCWINAIATPYQENGKTKSVSGSFQDITKRKLTELLLQAKSEEIEAQNEEYRQINEELKLTNQELTAAKGKAEENEVKLNEAQRIAHLGNWELNIETNELVWSDEIYRIFDCDPNEFKATYEAFLEFIHPDDREKVNTAYLESLETKKEYQIEHRLITKKQQLKYVREKCLTTFNEQGKPLNSFGIVIDITEQKELEYAIIAAKEKAEESEKKLKAALESMNDAVFISDTDGNFVDFNEAFATFHRFKNKQECAKTFKEYPVFLDVYFPNGVLAPIEQWVVPSALRGEMGINKEFTLLRKDTNETWIGSYNYAPIRNNEGQIIGSVVTCRDITNSKKTQFELFAAKEKAEESDRLKSAFLANMSHEIRTPMNGILGFAELLKEPDLSGAEQQEYIKIIEKSGDRMLSIINDIVDVSKIEAGLMNVDIKDCNINEKIEFLYTFFKPQVEEKGMQLLFKNTLPAKEAIIRTDNEKVYSILTNLVKNAIKYSIEGAIEFGYDIVETQCIASLQFYVKDTGIGIPKNRQSAIFERFIQVDAADKMARQGAGLGLSISKAYVEMLGGKIWVESEEGIGSTFYFTLPYNAEPEENKVIGKVGLMQGEDNQVIPEVSRLKILIAEDDETSEKLIALNVAKFSKNVLKARTGNEAVEVFRKNPDTDLILMDIQMPVMNGYEATRLIREFNKDVVIIAQTAYGLSGDREKAIEAGCNDYIAKPINKTELLSLIQKYFRKY